MNFEIFDENFMIFGQRELSKQNLKKGGKDRRRNFLIGPENLMGTTWRERYIWVQTGESMWQKLVGLCHRLPSTR
jgi:hypothetical protein